MDQLAIGLSLAVVTPWLNRTALGQSTRGARALAWLAAALSVGVICLYPHRPVIGFFHLGAVFAVAVFLAQRPAAQGPSNAIERALLGPLGSIGKLSFGLYLLHPIVIVGVSTAVTLEKVARPRGWTSFSARIENFTSSEVKSWPSCHLTPCRSLKV